MAEFLDFFRLLVGDIKPFKGLDYNTIKLTDEVRQRWEKFSSLSGIDDDIKDKCILSFERFAVYMLNDYKSLGKVFKNTKEENYWFSFALGCIRKSVKETGITINPDTVIRSIVQVSQFFKDKALTESEKGFYMKIDFEAELTVLISYCIIGNLVESGEYKLSKNRKKE